MGAGKMLRTVEKRSPYHLPPRREREGEGVKVKKNTEAKGEIFEKKRGSE